MREIQIAEKVDTRVEFVLEMTEEPEERGNVHPSDFHELDVRS